jgi:hypothetical protein
MLCVELDLSRQGRRVIGESENKGYDDTEITENFGQLHIVMILIKIFNSKIGSRVSSVSIVSDYGLDDRAIGVRSPAEAEDFSCSLCVQTGSGAHPASCTMGTGGPFLGG